jgi:mannose/fructose/sorbose-specific phosphotransferase system IIB component
MGGRSVPVVFFRIDDRLIHGQITVAWTKLSNPDVIAVVSDKVASNEIQRSALELAAPIGVEVAIYSISQAIKELSGKSPRNQKRIFVIVPTPEDALKLIEGDVKVKSVNVGQMGFTKGKKQISKTVSVSDDDVKAFRRLLSKGVEIEHRQLPGNKKIQFETLLPQTESSH